MKFVHRISTNSNREVRSELASLGINVDKGHPAPSRLVSFEIDECDRAWPDVQLWVVKRQALDIVRTVFSKEEITSANHLELVPDWHHGYPQPRAADFGFREATYDLSNFCAQCGIGAVQRAPFQIMGEPKWGQNNIFQLNWIFDEYFVTPRIWEDVFRPHGIGTRPVMGSKGRDPKTVVQIIIEKEVAIATHNLAMQKCSSCGRVKYAPVARGPLPPLIEPLPGHIAKTQQYFGSGASAYKCVVISQELARALQVKMLRGASFRPVEGRH
jgi:hypothetical protein